MNCRTELAGPSAAPMGDTRAVVTRINFPIYFRNLYFTTKGSKYNKKGKKKTDTHLTSNKIYNWRCVSVELNPSRNPVNYSVLLIYLFYLFIYFIYLFIYSFVHMTVSQPHGI